MFPIRILAFHFSFCTGVEEVPYPEVKVDHVGPERET